MTKKNKNELLTEADYFERAVERAGKLFDSYTKREEFISAGANEDLYGIFKMIFGEDYNDIVEHFDDSSAEIDAFGEKVMTTLGKRSKPSSGASRKRA